MKTAYQEPQPALSARDLAIITLADEIASGLNAAGYTLTLRQLFYQFVARGLFPPDRTYLQVGRRWVRDPKGTPNAEPNYKWLGHLVQVGRLAGLIDWDHIVDRTRQSRALPHYDDPAHAIKSASERYWIDRWSDQEYRPEVWVEKEALLDVVARPAHRHDMTYFAARGYASETSQHEAAMRFVDTIDAGQKPVIFHLGDHDPSGIDMTRDIIDRVNLFVEYWTSERVEVVRLALNMDQIIQYNPPPNPAKTTDSRFARYRDQFGEESWELDALDPPTIDALITSAVEAIRDDIKWRDKTDEEITGRSLLTQVSDEWDGVVARIEEG